MDTDEKIYAAVLIGLGCMTAAALLYLDTLTGIVAIITGLAFSIGSNLVGYISSRS